MAENINFNLKKAYFRDGSLFSDSQCRNIRRGPVYMYCNQYYLDEQFTKKLVIEVYSESQVDEETCSGSKSFGYNERTSAEISMSQTAASLTTVDSEMLLQEDFSTDTVSLTDTNDGWSENEISGDNSSVAGDYSSTTRNVIWTENETKFLIITMSDYVKENETMPQTMVELERRIRLGKGKKRNMWKEVADIMSFKFDRTFDPKNIARKWQTLVDGFKKVLDNNNKTGRGTCRFLWFNEMNELIGGRHDIKIVVSGSQKGVIIHRPEQVNPVHNTSENVKLPNNDESVTPTSVQPSTSGRSFDRKRKRPANKEDEARSDIQNMLEYMKEADEKSLRLEQNMLNELCDFNKSMSSMFEKLIHKM